MLAALYKHQNTNAMPTEKELKLALIDAVNIIEGLVDQQAMFDDWYSERLSKLQDIVDGFNVTPTEISSISDAQKDELWEQWYCEYAIKDANEMWECMDEDERVEWLLGSGAASTCFYEWLKNNVSPNQFDIPVDVE